MRLCYNLNSNLSLEQNLQFEDIRIFMFEIYVETATGGVHGKGFGYLKKGSLLKKRPWHRFFRKNFAKFLRRHLL